MHIRHFVVKSAEEERLVHAEVYSPLHIDTDGESMTAEEIRKAAHRFISSGRVHKIDIQHNQIESGCSVVESYIAKALDPDGFIEGAWVLVIYIEPDDIWESVKKGDLNGLSFHGVVNKVPVKANVVVTRKMIGETEDSAPNDILPLHAHPVIIDFDDSGRILAGATDEALGHSHPILRATATEKELDHAHRIILINNAEVS